MVRFLVALALAATAGASAAPRPAHVLFRLTDPRLTEVSGIAQGLRSPGVFYVQNDGGDTARVFALDRRTGRVLSQVHVTGARNVDWEDLAVARGPRGVPSVWIADTGDNGGTRGVVQIYRVPEPRITPRSPRAIKTAPADVWRVRYPSGHPDAESLAVTPAGRAFIMTKNATGGSTVYQVPASPSRRVQVLRRVGAVHFPLTDVGAGPAGPLSGLLATGAALSRNGHRLVVRTYTAAYFWPVGTGGVPAALQHRPTRIRLPKQPQGEGITFAGDRVVVDSERVGSQVFSVPVPPVGSRRPAPSTVPSTAPSAVPQRPAGESSGASTGVVAGVAGGVTALGIAAVVWRTKVRGHA